ncbi:uncharacterized protein LOC111086175 [Limulus polyphemus]|uniref:Uncharacterized protein LOC111086175 n=1 Tax=Limulus polyphemus TaxID=6850 RepID=A0ABM1SJ93_LIMPO|nr:uncharacterized protein LOC111086175 [Limulus polyphemus]
MKLCWVESGEQLEMHTLVTLLTHLYKNKNVMSVGNEDFESKWQALHTFPREYSLPFIDASSHSMKFENNFVPETTVHSHAKKIDSSMSSTDLSQLPCETPSYESFVTGDEELHESISPSLQNLKRSVEESSVQAEHITGKEEIPATELLPYQNLDGKDKNESIYQDGVNMQSTEMTQLMTSTGLEESGIINATPVEENFVPLCNLTKTFFTSRDMFQNDLQTTNRVQEVLIANATTAEISIEPVELDDFDSHDKQNDDLNKSAISSSFKIPGSQYSPLTRTFQHCNLGKDEDFPFTDELLSNKQVLELTESDTENVDSESDVITFQGTNHKSLKMQLYNTTVSLCTTDLTLTDKSHTSSGEPDGVNSDSYEKISENFMLEENSSETILTNLLGKDYEEKEDSENLEQDVSTQLDISSSLKDGQLLSVEKNCKRKEHTSFDTSVETERSFSCKNKSSVQCDSTNSMISGEDPFVKHISTGSFHSLEKEKPMHVLQTCFDKAATEKDLSSENSGFSFLSDNYLYSPEMIAVTADYVGKEDLFCGLPETENKQFGAYESKLGRAVLCKDKEKLFGQDDEIEKNEGEEGYVFQQKYSVIDDLNNLSTFMFNEDNFNSEVKEKPVIPPKECLENEEDGVQDLKSENGFETKKDK